jgi:putative transposase
MQDMGYQHAGAQVYLINYHLMWCPKRRRAILVGKIKHRLEQIIRQTAKEMHVEVLDLAVNPDHLHLSVSAYPQLPVHKIVKRFKARSSHMLRREFPELLKLPSLWTHAYFVSTASHVSAKTIQDYTHRQSKR